MLTSLVARRRPKTHRFASVSALESRTLLTSFTGAEVSPPVTTDVEIVESPHTETTQTKGGEEIYPDEFGRVKVQFSWDRQDPVDDHSSCWVRVSQVHAGSLFVPEVSDEVVIAFMEGDIDQPIIIGRLYNDEQMPPFELPDSKPISGFKSNSTQAGGGFNELIFDDSQGSEQITIHAQKDLDTTVEVNQTQTVGSNQTISVGASHTETVDKDGTITIQGKEITLKGSGEINPQSGGDIILKGKKILEN